MQPFTDCLSPVQTQYHPVFPPGLSMEQIRPFLVPAALLCLVVFLCGVFCLLYKRQKPAKTGPDFPEIHIREPFLIAIIPVLLVACTSRLESIHNMEEMWLLNYPEISLWDAILLEFSGNHYPLYTIFLDIVSVICPEPWFYRSMGALVFGLGVFAFYNLCHEMLGRKTAVFLSLMFAVSPWSIYYAGIIQPYNFMRTGVSFFLWFFFLWSKGVKKAGTPLVLASICVMYLGLYGFFVLFSALPALFFADRTTRKERFQDIQGIMGILFILAAPLVFVQVILLSMVRLNLAAQVIADPYLPMELPLLLQSVHDFLRFAGFQVCMFSQPAPTASGLAVFLAFILLVIRDSKTIKANLLMRTWGICLAVTFLAYTHSLHVLNRDVGGWYPFWRHCMILVPFLFLFPGKILKTGLEHPVYKHRVRALIFLILVLQVASSYRILTDTQIPDSKGAWEYIRARFRDGDAVCATPVPLFNNHVLMYYGFPGVKRHSLTWHNEENTGYLYFNLNDQHATFSSMEKILFIERIWHVAYDFRFYGIYPEFGLQSSRRFSGVFSRWPVTQEKKLPFLTIRLHTRPFSPVIDCPVLLIKAGVNDLSYVRMVYPGTRHAAKMRVIQEESQLFIPENACGIPFFMEVETGKGRILAKINTDTKEVQENGFSGQKPKGAGSLEIRASRYRNGFLIPLEKMAGMVYRTIRIRFVPDSKQAQAPKKDL